jgi:hypothetical protein
LLCSQFAKAGFVFQPTPASPDNVVCFMCDKALDGWEEDDDPLVEHLKHVPDCGWAIVAAVEAELGEYAKLHPLDPQMIAARKATFAGRWPYDGKKAWKCKTKQVRLGFSLYYRASRLVPLTLYSLWMRGGTTVQQLSPTIWRPVPTANSRWTVGRQATSHCK